MTWTSFGPLKTSHPCLWTAPLHALSKVSLYLHTHLFFCLIWWASANLFCVPVLRRSCLFQENSATKRVSTMAYSRRYIMKSNTEKPSLYWFSFILIHMHRFFSPRLDVIYYYPSTAFILFIIKLCLNDSPHVDNCFRTVMPSTSSKWFNRHPKVKSQR